MEKHGHRVPGFPLNVCRKSKKLALSMLPQTSHSSSRGYKAVRHLIWLALWTGFSSFPVRSAASCQTGATPSYDDITYVYVEQHALVGNWPWYTYRATLYANAPKPHADLALDARRAPLHGTFVASDPLRAFHDIVSTLRRDDFFAIRLGPTNNWYLDGPEDAVSVGRCGVTTTVSTVPLGVEFDLSDARGQAFLRLEADLRNAIFSENWTPLSTPSVTPTPALSALPRDAAPEPSATPLQTVGPGVFTAIYALPAWFKHDYAVTPGQATVIAVHAGTTKVPVVRRVNIAGAYATVFTSGGILEGSPVTAPVLLQHFSFGWQALDVLTDGCALRTRGPGARVNAALMRGMPSPKNTTARAKASRQMQAPFRMSRPCVA